jgi:hypothetical protein
MGHERRHLELLPGSGNAVVDRQSMATMTRRYTWQLK